MPKVNQPLTDKEIKALKPQDKIYKKSDGGNLFVFVNPTNRKYFVYEYKSPITLKMRRITIGNYPEISLKEAREKKEEYKMMIKSGVDPLFSTNKKTFKDVALKWWEIKRSRITEKTYKIQRRYVEMYIFPYFENREIDSIKINEVLKVFDNLQKRKIYETQKRTFLMTREIFSFAKQRGYVSSNIMLDIDYSKNFILPVVNHFTTITDNKEIKALLLNMDEYKGDFATKTALKLSIYTAQRPFNIRSAEWSEFDLDNGVWIIQSEKMKMNEKHIVPLSKQVIELIKEHEKMGKRGKYLFPSARSAQRPMSDNTVNAALRRMGYTKNEIVAHGFRAMFSTICNEYRQEHGLSHDIIELCLAHKERNEIRSAYNHAINLKERDKLMQWWADFLFDLKG